jgi:hypothetical protein
MFLCRVQKRVAAVITGMALLLCQGAALAQACFVVPSGSDRIVAQQPCHTAGEQPSSNTHVASGSCQDSSPALSGFQFFAAADLPVVTTPVEPIVVVADSVRPGEPLLRVEPPPLAILHCCFRN